MFADKKYFMKKILAIDYGSKRIGLAISHATLADPLVIIDNGPDKSDQAQAIDRIKQICEDEGVEQIVVGISENEMAEKTKEFTQQLKGLIKLPIEFFDETLSSQIVRQKLVAAGIKQKKRRGPIDHYAAALILEEWIEAN
jgi:putative pre-16S rRNA nuclease